MKRTLLLCSLLALATTIFAQDSLRNIRFAALPAVAFSPENGFTYGAIGEMYYDAAQGDPDSRMSRLQAAVLNSTKQRFYVLLATDLFTKDNNYWLYGRARYRDYTDRYYGIGNDADARFLYTPEDETEGELLNYYIYRYRSLTFEGVALKRLTDRLYVGVQYIYDDTYGYQDLGQRVEITDELPAEPRVDNRRSGPGIRLAFDGRDNINYALEGAFLQFNAWTYPTWLGTDFDYSSISLDARKYWRTVGTQVFAARVRVESRLAHDDNTIIPLFDLARLGGLDYIRGYFEGTYQDRHGMSFQTEYRFPILQDADAPIWKLWRRFGLVGFFSGGRVYNTWDELSLSDWRLSAGIGLRLLLIPEQRVNVRIDYGWGFAPDAAGPEGRQSGLYFFVGETF